MGQLKSAGSAMLPVQAAVLAALQLNFGGGGGGRKSIEPGRRALESRPSKDNNIGAIDHLLLRSLRLDISGARASVLYDANRP